MQTTTNKPELKIHYSGKWYCVKIDSDGDVIVISERFHKHEVDNIMRKYPASRLKNGELLCVVSAWELDDLRHKHKQ